MPLRPGTLLQDRYEIRGVLEDHGSASVWSAVDLRLGREVVVRGFPLPPPDASNSLAELERRTAALAAQIHPRLQTLLDFVQSEGMAYAITKPSLGRSLADHLWQGPLPWAEARRILDGVLELLEVAHARAMPHLRMDPSTIVLDPEGAVRLRHFAQGPTDLLPAKDPHRAPEMERGDFGPAADLYACGALVPDLLGPEQEDWPEDALRFHLQLCHPMPGERPVSARAARAFLKPQAAAVARPARRLGWWGAGLVSVLLLGWIGLHGRQARIKPGQLDPKARSAYLLAREHLARRTSEDLRKAEDSYAEVLKAYPSCAEAWSGLALVQALEGVYGLLPHREALSRARTSATRALDLDSNGGEAVAVMAYLDLRYEWKWIEADAGFRRAVALAPDSPHVRHWRGFQLSLAGRPAEAISELEIAHRLDPVERQISTNLAVARIWGGDLEGGISLLEELIYHDPRFSSARDRLRMALDAEGRIPESLDQVREMVRLGMVPSWWLDTLEQGWKQGGRSGYYKARLRLVHYPLVGVPDHFFEAELHALLGDRDAAFKALEEALDQKSMFAIWGPQDPALRSLHDDPRWKTFLASIHYPGA